MINGAHVLLYSRHPDADRAFFKEVLGLKSVDAGHGWLIFALPPSEVAVHPTKMRKGSGTAAASCSARSATSCAMISRPRSRNSP